MMPGRIPKLLWPAMACLTLGLAPFFPEPHIVGKLRWVFGGAVGMSAADWFDLVFHGAPWLWLAVALVRSNQEDAGSRWARLGLAAAVLGAALCLAWAAWGR